MFSRSSTNRKRSQSATILSSIANVHHQNSNNNNKRIKIDPNRDITQNGTSTSTAQFQPKQTSAMLTQSSTTRKRNRSALSSIANVHQNSSNNKRIKVDPNQDILSTNCKITKVSHNTSELQSSGSCSSSRALHLNHLPLDCLNLIFKRITLQHRITRLCLVCHHWKSTVDQMCTIKGQLTINLFSNYKPRVVQLVTSDLEQYWENVKNEKMESLLLKNAKRLIPDLSIRFPLVTQLVIRSNDTTERQNRASLQLFLSLLDGQQQKWCSSLTSLTLYKMSIITDPTFLPQLCSMINCKFNPSNLTQLNLYIQAFGPETGDCHPERVSLYNVLPQLKRFFAVCCFRKWTSVMRTLGDPANKKNRVKDIELSERKISLNNLTRLLSKTQFTSTVTHLHLTSIRSREWFSLICDSFGSLQFLQIYVGNHKFDPNWLTDLRKLPHLTELKMHRLPLDPTMAPLAVTTINKLTICDDELLTKFQVATGENQFNSDLYCRLLSHHFPSVSVLILMSNEKKVKMVERNIRKWTQVHFKQIEKMVLVLKAVEYKNHDRDQNKFMKKYDKSLRN